MNWFLVGVVILLTLCALHGYHKGFIKKCLSIFFLLISIVLSSILTPYVSTFLEEQTPLYTYLEDQCSSSVEDYLSSNTDLGESQLIENMNLPGPLKSLLSANNNSAIYDMLSVTNFSHYLGGTIARWILNTITYMITFLIIMIALKILGHVLNIVDKLPVIRGINKIAGLALGLAQGVLIMWVVFIGVTLLASTSMGRQAFAMINDSVVLSILYETNLLLNIIMDIIPTF